MSQLFVKKGDKVAVLAGKDKGKSGKVLRALPKKNRVVVEGLNLTKKATKPTQKNAQGGIITREGTIHVSNVAVFCPSCDRAARLGHRRTEDGHSLRICRRCGSDLDKE